MCYLHFNTKCPVPKHHIITLYRIVETYGPKYSVLDLKNLTGAMTGFKHYLMYPGTIPTKNDNT